MTLTHQFPEHVARAAPESVSTDVARNYVRGREALDRGESETSIMLLGKALDTLLRERYPHVGDGMLGNKLAKLKPDVDVPKALHDWASHLKAVRNEATHEAGEPPIEDVQELAAFAEMLLLYTYTLPAMLTARREATS